LPTFTRNFFESLVGRLTPRTVLVFDNYHEVPADSPLHELLPVGWRALPRDLRTDAGKQSLAISQYAPISLLDIQASVL
jgi:hypothetical protein